MHALPHSVPTNLQQATADPRLHWRLLDTHRQVWVIPKKNKCKKAKWLSDEALQIAEKRREAKGKGGKVRYTHSNVEVQWIRRDKKAFLSDTAKK